MRLLRPKPHIDIQHTLLWILLYDLRASIFQSQKLNSMDKTMTFITVSQGCSSQGWGSKTENKINALLLAACSTNIRQISGLYSNWIKVKGYPKNVRNSMSCHQCLCEPKVEHRYQNQFPSCLQSPRSKAQGFHMNHKKEAFPTKKIDVD